MFKNLKVENPDTFCVFDKRDKPNEIWQLQGSPRAFFRMREDGIGQQVYVILFRKPRPPWDQA
ncbi:MAG: hypothetical protein PHY73_01505 [Candidatus Omnitrophica bacterium]|nr:hypothetical protein [Candidatus Omnitrophota bacterium]